MAEFNIAQIGTFDCENIGDLLFPTVLKAQLEKRIKLNKLFLISLNGCTRPLDETNETVYPIDMLESLHLKYGIDAIILGGGDLIRFDNGFVANDNYLSENTAFDLIFYPAMIANKYDIPFLWNCPGVPFEFSDSDKLTLRQYLKHVDYVSTRDNKSRALIEGTGTDKKVNVFPDSVLSISTLVDVKETLSSLKARYDFLNGKYFVFQSFPALNDSYLPELKAQLKEVVNAYNLPIIMFPIGRVHNDHQFLKELINELNDPRFIYIEEKLNLTESCALLSGADLFIGTSLHGNIISNSYGTPSIALDAGNLIKVRNSFKILDREKYCIKDISSLKATVDEVLKNPQLSMLDKAISEVNTHFDNIAEKIMADTEKTSFMEALRYTFYHQYQPRNTVTFYFDCGDGFSQDNAKEISYYTLGKMHFEAELPQNCINVRIDPIEQVYSLIKNLKITMDSVPCKYTHNGIETDGDIFFNNIDPNILISSEGAKTIEIDFEIEIMPIKHIDDMSKELSILKPTLNDTYNHVKNLDSIIEYNNSVITQLNSTVENLNSIIGSLREEINEKSQKITDMENSLSWKITKPMRKVKSAVTKK